jgi:hypothetical protein
MVGAGSSGATAGVGFGQGGTAPSNGGSNGQGGAEGPDGSAGASAGRVPFSPDANEAAAPEDVGSGVMDARASDSGGGSDGGFVDAGPVGPIVPPDCPGDPSAGWTEYTEIFKIQRPYDLMESDRYNFANGIYDFWVFPNDKPFEVGNSTAPRTEARYPNMTGGQKMWTGDILVDSPSNTTTIFQVHHTTTGAGPVYLQVNGGTLRELNGQVVVSNIIGKWFNLKVAFDPATANATIYVNNCQKLMLRNSRPGDHVYYFKHGVYTCTSSVCRDHYKNVHLYQR